MFNTRNAIITIALSMLATSVNAQLFGSDRSKERQTNLDTRLGLTSEVIIGKSWRMTDSLQTQRRTNRKA